MKATSYLKNIHSSLSDFNLLRAQAKSLAAQISIGRSAFLDAYGVGSELEYKQQAIRDRQIMYHAHIGLSDIGSTAAAVAKIHQQLTVRGFHLDRAGFALD